MSDLDDELADDRVAFVEWPEHAGPGLPEARIAARVRLYKAQRERDLDRVRWEQKRNPSPNPSKDEDRSWSKRIRMGPFGGEKRPASGLGKR